MALKLETDAADILTEMIYCTRKCGKIGILGVYIGKTNHFPIGVLMEKGQMLQGSQSPTQKYWKMFLEKIKTGELDPSFIVTHRGKLSDGPEFYKKFFKKEEGLIKAFMTPN